MLIEPSNLKTLVNPLIRWLGEKIINESFPMFLRLQEIYLYMKVGIIKYLGMSIVTRFFLSKASMNVSVWGTSGWQIERCMCVCVCFSMSVLWLQWFCVSVVLVCAWVNVVQWAYVYHFVCNVLNGSPTHLLTLMLIHTTILTTNEWCECICVSMWLCGCVCEWECYEGVCFLSVFYWVCGCVQEKVCACAKVLFFRKSK